VGNVFGIQCYQHGLGRMASHVGFQNGEVYVFLIDDIESCLNGARRLNGFVSNVAKRIDDRFSHKLVAFNN